MDKNWEESGEFVTPEYSKRFRVTKRFEFDAAHRLLGHLGKCYSLHGHRYGVEVTLIRSGGLNDKGMVLDFQEMSVVKEWIDEHWDHVAILNDSDPLLKIIPKEMGMRIFQFRGDPTAEQMALFLFNKCRAWFPVENGYLVINVKVYETPTCWAEVVP